MRRAAGVLRRVRRGQPSRSHRPQPPALGERGDPLPGRGSDERPRGRLPVRPRCVPGRDGGPERRIRRHQRRRRQLVAGPPPPPGPERLGRQRLHRVPAFRLCSRVPRAMGGRQPREPARGLERRRGRHAHATARQSLAAGRVQPFHAGSRALLDRPGQRPGDYLRTGLRRGGAAVLERASARAEFRGGRHHQRGAGGPRPGEAVPGGRPGCGGRRPAGARGLPGWTSILRTHPIG